MSRRPAPGGQLETWPALQSRWRKRPSPHPGCKRDFFKFTTRYHEDTCPKMLLVTIYITTIFIIRLNICLASETSLQHQHNRHRQNIKGVVVLSEKLIDDGDAKYDLECPLDEIITPRSNLPRQAIAKKLQQIKQQVHIRWLKNGEPFWRENGNEIYALNNYTYVLFTIRESDAGNYTCLVNYTNVPDSLLEHFDISQGASYNLIVSSRGNNLPDSRPTISHPPTDLIVPRAANVTFTCNRTDTLSHQTTYWFKSCPFPKNKTCVTKFLNAYNRARESENPDYLKRYFIRGHREDVLTVHDVADNQTGYYGCAVRNSQGADVRLGSLELIDTWLRSQAQLGIVDSLTSDNENSDWIWIALGIGAFLIIAIGIIGCIYLFKLSIQRDKKQKSPLLSPTIGNDVVCANNKDANLRQHLPNIDCPDIYNIGKTADGFISGHLHQDTGHLLSQSICSNILNKKKNPSISSSNSQHSDEASSSWGKSMSSNGDNSRAFYLHTSNTTATTVPMYDHPPSTGTLLRPCGTLVQDACVINPTYGFLRPENDATEWAFPRRNLDRLNKIGEGQFGEVWRYIARQKDGNGDIVAVKQLKNRAGLGDRERFELIAEIEIMKLVNNHPNVIKLLHYCVDEYEPILLIMEYAENGKLQTYLRNCRASRKSYGCLNNDSSPSVTSKDLIKFTYHIAKGMEYVASKGIVHRDLASRNILVSKDKICKVADFGFARRVNDDCAYERTTTNPVPVKWMAPEALVENKFTSKSDVFSLGILMWEIVTLGATPYEQLTSEGVYKKVTTGGRLERPSHCRDEFYSLMAQCWQHDPLQRPSFKEVACQLEKLLLSENDYIELDQYPEHAYYNIISTEEKDVVPIVL